MQLAGGEFDRHHVPEEAGFRLAAAGRQDVEFMIIRQADPSSAMGQQGHDIGAYGDRVCADGGVPSRDFMKLLHSRTPMAELLSLIGMGTPSTNSLTFAPERISAMAALSAASTAAARSR